MSKYLKIFLTITCSLLLVGGTIYGASSFMLNTDIAGTFDVTGAATFDSSLTVAGNTALAGNLIANGDVSLGNLPADTLTLNAGLVYGVQTITTGIDFSPATLTTDIVLSNGATIDNASDGTVLVTGGTLRSGASAGVNAAGGRDMIYGYYKGITTALTGTGRGVYGRAVIDIDSPSGTLQGGQFKATSGSCASCADAVNLATATGLYVEVGHGNAGGTAKTLVNARALELNLDLDAADVAVTNAYGIYMKYNTGSSGGVITNGYGLWIDNESVQGTGQTMDAGFYLSDTSVATAGWDYGLDFSAASIGTADIRLSNGETIFNSPDGVIAFSGALKLPKDAASAADALNTTKPTGITCNADSLGTITWVDDTDTNGAWLWVCQQIAPSSYDWYSLR